MRAALRYFEKQPLCDEAILSQTGLRMTYAKVSDWLQIVLGSGMVAVLSRARGDSRDLTPSIGETSERLMVAFVLPAGAYTTMAVRELIDTDPV